MLPVDQAIAAVRGFSARKQQRIAARPHQRIRAEHRAELKGAIAERMLRHAHQHSADEGFAVAPWARLMIVDQVYRAVGHQHPVARHGHRAAHRGGRIRLPRSP
jgi:hypothetical protein